MAEILGTVASGLAVAEVGLKVGGTVWKLKRLWQEVHEVPETIAYLMKEIEIIEPVLSEFEGNFNAEIVAFTTPSPAYDSVPAARSSAYCREALNDLRNLVGDLDGAIASEKKRMRTLARIRVVLKKDTIKGFQGRLERATRLLQSAQVNYLTATVTDMRAMMMAQPQVQVQQLSNGIQSNSIGSPPFPVITQHGGVVSRHTPVKGNKAEAQRNSVFLPWPGPSLFGAIVVRKFSIDLDKYTTYAARIQLPKWLSQRVWDISVNHACYGWQGNLLTWNIVPYDCPGMLCAKRGDLEGLLDLFSRGLASHQDCTIDGETIFHVACKYSQTHMVQRLIDMNLDKMRDDITAKEASKMIFTDRLSMDIMQPLVSRGFFDSLSNGAQDFNSLPLPIPANGATVSSFLCLSAASTRQDVFELYLRTCFPFWHTLRPRKKQIILGAIAVAPNWTVDAVRLLICPSGSVQAIDMRTWLDDGVSLLQLVMSLYLNSYPGDTTKDWHALLQEIITVTDDLHLMLKPLDYSYGLSSGACSAFKSALVSTLAYIFVYKNDWPGGWKAQDGLKHLKASLQSLMSIIATCGHDLLEFGRQEAAIWVGQDDTCRIANEALVVETVESFRKHEPQWYLWVIHYGPEPLDWYFECEFPKEYYAGEFWALVERPPPTPMPGAWVDEH